MTRAITREEILSMPAGRELDALVAEQVMEYRAVYENDRSNTITAWKYGDEKFVPAILFKPSTDIAAAWEIASKYPMFEIKRIEYFIRNVTHEATLYMNLDDGEVRFGVSAKTAAEAICKAALLSLLKED